MSVACSAHPASAPAHVWSFDVLVRVCTTLALGPSEEEDDSKTKKITGSHPFDHKDEKRKTTALKKGSSDHVYVYLSNVASTNTAQEMKTLVAQACKRGEARSARSNLTRESTHLEKGLFAPPFDLDVQTSMLRLLGNVIPNESAVGDYVVAESAWEKRTKSSQGGDDDNDVDDEPFIAQILGFHLY